MSNSLIKRVATIDNNFVKDLEFEPRVSAGFELKLDSQPVFNAIHSMDFLEMKGLYGNLILFFLCPLMVSNK